MPIQSLIRSLKSSAAEVRSGPGPCNFTVDHGPDRGSGPAELLNLGPDHIGPDHHVRTWSGPMDREIIDYNFIIINYLVILVSLMKHDTHVVSTVAKAIPDN